MSLAHNSNLKLNSRIILCVFFLQLVLTPLAAVGQEKGQGLEIRTISQILHQVAPGRILSLTFQVAQSTGREERFEESLSLPVGWQPVTPPTPFTLASGERTVRILAVLVPAGAPAGSYDLRYQVRSQRDYAIQDIASVAIEVLPVRKLSFMIEEKPDSVVAGRSYSVRFRLLNQGNFTVQVNLRADSRRAGYAQHIEPASATISAGQSIAVVVTGSTNARERKSFTHYVQVIAQPVEGKESPAVVTYGIEVLPVATGEMGLEQTLPTRLSLRMTGDNTTHGVQVTWEGSGALDEAGTRMLDFLVQGPDTQRDGIFGLRDELHLNYNTPQSDFHLGDQSYSLSNLTDFYHYGRGLGVDFRMNDGYHLGAYTMRERWSESRQTVNGAYLSQRTEAGEVKVNYATKTDKDNTDRLWSIESAFPLLKRSAEGSFDAAVTTEYAHSNTDRDGFSPDNAYRVELTGRYGQGTRLIARKIHAGPDYRGYYRDCDYLDTTLAFPVMGCLRGDLQYSACQQNLRLDPARNTAPDEHLAQAGLYYDLPSGWTASLGYNHYRRRDLLQPQNGIIDEQPFVLRLARAFGFTSWNAEYRMGSYRNEALHIDHQVSEARLYAAYQPSPRQLFSVYGGYRNDGIGSTLLGPSTHLGASISWRPTDALSLSGWFNSSNLNQPSGNKQGEMSARYCLPGDRAWELRVLTGKPSAGPSSTSYLLSYSLPIEMPVGRKKNVGLLRGRVFDSRHADHPGIQDVVLRMNKTAVITDHDGNYAFPSLSPGKYTLTIDEKSIGLNRITIQQLPLDVTIDGGKTTSIDLGVMPTARLSGHVMIRPADSQSANQVKAQPVVVGDPNARGKIVSRGVGDILVELSNGTEILRRLTDANGVFLFERLRPGRWQMKIYDANLPAYHVLEKSTMDIELTDQQVADVTVNVLPLMRRIKMLEPAGGVLVSQSPASAQ